MLTTTNADRKRREEIATPKFKALIASPSAVPFKMPGNATLGVRRATAIVQGATVATLTGRSVRTIGVNATAANVVRSIGYVERGVTVAPTTGIEVLVRVGFKWRKIAQG
ncbi:MAG: hypothetical protein C0465_26400 [Ralstonia sp.]|jgi:hypothetical protein|uniref:hypothetical protein n=1 Tax=Ralstonia sp. TaxID=54061 RepID=UPI00257A5D11|nr:hypothetical protein [Ralstonia sp.]MBA4234107.1 hypothetical protein [Ralstonia sp.]MBA4239011.1 hypothetical protein [Ralstonia sp.]